MTRRERRRQRDGYIDDNTAADGEIVRRPHHLADSVIRREEALATPRFRYGQGYVDSISDPVKQGGWPTQTEGIWPMYNNAVGDPCKCQNGRDGTAPPNDGERALLRGEQRSRSTDGLRCHRHLLSVTR